MEARNVTKILFVLLMAVPLMSVIAQEKYLLFDAKKDSIVQLDSISYYKIDKNLFDIDRYSEIDTINLKQSNSLKFSSVESLWKERQDKDKEIIKNIKYGDPIPVFDTFNTVFIFIYILEKIDDCKYKRTRVWWIDY